MTPAGADRTNVKGCCSMSCKPTPSRPAHKDLPSLIQLDRAIARRLTKQDELFNAADIHEWWLAGQIDLWQKCYADGSVTYQRVVPEPGVFQWAPDALVLMGEGCELFLDERQYDAMCSTGRPPESKDEGPGGPGCPKHSSESEDKGRTKGKDTREYRIIRPLPSGRIRTAGTMSNRRLC